jgi:hypothetical protein
MPGAKFTFVVNLRIIEALEAPFAVLPDQAKNIDMSMSPGIAILISDATGNSRRRDEPDIQIGQILSRGESYFNRSTGILAVLAIK